MDASDTIRKNKSKAIYIDQLNKFINQNPGGDCGKLSTCTSSITNCSHYFDSYGLKYDFYTGKNACTGCACATDGGSQ